ncbi:hypothetical protein SLS54_006489 [Diplodia seriata]
MPRYEVDQKVLYKAIGGPDSNTPVSHGTIMSVITSDARMAGHNVKASEEDPRYEVSCFFPAHREMSPTFHFVANKPRGLKCATPALLHLTHPALSLPEPSLHSSCTTYPVTKVPTRVKQIKNDNTGKKSAIFETNIIRVIKP